MSTFFVTDIIMGANKDFFSKKLLDINIYLNHLTSYINLLK